MSSVKKILHIAPHLNGGLGNVLTLQSRCRDTDHYIYLIESKAEDYPNINKNHSGKLLDYTHSAIADTISKYDIVQVEYWNHPLIYKLVLSGVLDDAKCLIGCAHIQGDQAPQLISENIIEYFDHMLITGQWLSATAKDQRILGKISFVRYPIDTVKFSPSSQNNPSSSNSKLRACYVGTVSFSKMSRDFFDIVQACTDFLDFIIVGEPDDEVRSHPGFHDSNISFIGRSKDVVSYLRKSDIFIYPLRKGHYGTGELALVEALSCGLPTVAFNNESEMSLIENNYNGVLCSNKGDFVRALQRLSSSEKLRNSLGAAARKKIAKLYNFEGFEAFLRNFYGSIYHNRERAKYKIYKEELLKEVDDGGKCFIQSLQGIKNVNANVIPSIISAMSPSICAKKKKIAISFFERYPEYKYKSKGGLGHYRYCFPESISFENLMKHLSTKDQP